MSDIYAATIQVLRDITINSHDSKNEGKCRYCRQESYDHLDWCPVTTIDKFLGSHIGPISEIIATNQDDDDAKS